MKRILLSLGLALLGGCGQDPQSGGGGIEIPNGLNLTVNSSDNKPVQGVAVRLLARESWARRTVDGSSVVLDSAKTDQAGHVKFTLPPGEGYWVEASTGAMGVRAQGDSAETKTVVLAPLSKLNGYLGSGPIAGVRVRLAGSTRTTVTDAQGRFQFDSLPQSNYAMVAVNSGGQKLSMLGNLGVGIDPVNTQGLANDTSSLILDDFADGDVVWGLHDIFGTGFWWVACNNPDIKSVFGIEGAWRAIQVDSVPRRIHVAVDATRMSVAPWAALGVDLGPIVGTHPDFSAAKTFRVKIRGNGTWFLKIVVDRGDTTVNWSSPVPMTPTWTEQRISTSSLVPEYGVGELWNLRPRKVLHIMLQTSGSGWIDLSELAVEGASLTDWTK